MFDAVFDLMQPQFIVTMLAGLAAFATALAILMPLLARDKLSSRMQLMAVERDKMRAARIADLAKKENASRLRSTPKGFMQEIVDKLKLRSMFDTEETRDRLKMAGLRGQAPLVAYMFFRVALPIMLTMAAMPMNSRIAAVMSVSETGKLLWAWMSPASAMDFRSWRR